MLPTSEELEAFYDRLNAMDDRLGRLKTAEVKHSDMINDLAEVAKDWLKLSAMLSPSDSFDSNILNNLDAEMTSVLNSTRLRTRASVYKKRIKSLREVFYGNFIIPAIRLEASPAEVAKRDLLNILSKQITPTEEEYIDEAARCLTLRCHKAAIIMLWSAAIARMHSVIEQAGFDTFNTALAAANAKKVAPFKYIQNSSPVSSPAELQRMRDFDILVVGMELWKYDLPIFEELERLLGTRNNAAHPGMLDPTALDVLQFARKLNDYVFARIHFI